jgi:2-hydroxychromene-2-carboxylate isomerase
VGAAGTAYWKETPMAQSQTATRSDARTATQTVAFYLDPLCPWAWRASEWMRQVRQVRPVRVDWRFFCLEEVNKGDGEVDWEGGRSAPVLRVLALVRRQHGNEAVDRFYAALGQARFVRDEQYAPAVVEAALEAAGLDRGLRAAALADPSTRDAVLAEHAALVGRDGAFGVPTLVLDAGDGPGIFGPVSDPVPQGEAAGELWDHVVWLTRQPGFFELKRSRK